MATVFDDRPMISGGSPPPALVAPLSVLRGDRSRSALEALYLAQPNWLAGLARGLRNFASTPLAAVGVAAHVDDFAPQRRLLAAPAGAFMCQLARMTDARLMVVLGTSCGASAIWLASALHENTRSAGDRAIIGFEADAASAIAARQALRKASVSRYVDIRHDDPRQVLARLEERVDLMLIDDDRATARSVLEVLAPRLQRGAIIVTTKPNAPDPRRESLLAFLRDPGNGFHSLTVSAGEAIELSVRA